MKVFDRLDLILCVALALSSLSLQRAAAGTIADAKATPLGSPVTIDAMVISNTVDLVSSASFASIDAQDNTGGITIFGPTSDIANIVAAFPAGTGINVQGTSLSFDGLLEIQPIRTDVTLAGVGVPSPTVTTSADYIDFSATAETLESRLVSLANVHFTGIAPGQKFTGLTNYTATDGVRNVVVRISTNSQSLVGQPIPTDQISLKGIFSEFDATNPSPGVAGTGYELLLLDNSSISHVPEPSTMLQLTSSIWLAALWLTRRRSKVRPSRNSI